MKKQKKFMLCVFIVLVIFIFFSCADKLKIEVEINDRENITITNVSKKLAENIDLTMFIKRGREEYFYKIDKLDGFESCKLKVSAFIDKEGSNYCGTAFNISSINFEDGIKIDRWVYRKPSITEDPAGKIFRSKDKKDLVRFYKYKKQVIIRVEPGLNSNNSGTFSYEIENGKIVTRKISGRVFWTGVFAHEHLDIKEDFSYLPNQGKNIVTPMGIRRELSFDLDLVQAAGTEYWINKQEFENRLDYLNILLLYLKVYNTEKEAIAEYAKIFHANDYDKYFGDQFEWHDFEKKMKVEYKKKISEVPMKELYTTRFFIKLGDYDFDKGGFKLQPKIDIKADTNFLNLDENLPYNFEYLEDKYNYFTAGMKIANKKVSFGAFVTHTPVDLLLRMDREKAKEFSETNKNILCIAQFKMNPDLRRPRYLTLSIDPNDFQGDLEGVIERLVFYDSEEEMNLLNVEYY